MPIFYACRRLFDGGCFYVYKALFRFAKGTFVPCLFGRGFVSAAGTTPSGCFALFVESAVFELIVQVVKDFLVLFFDVGKHFEGVCNVLESFRARGFFKRFVEFDFALVVFCGESKV